MESPRCCARSPRRFLAAMRDGSAIAVVTMTLFLPACTGGASDAELAQARAEGSRAQSQLQEAQQQQDSQASLATDVQKLKEETARAAEEKAAAEKAAADQAAADKAAADNSAVAQTPCGGVVSAGPTTSCAFAINVANSYLRSGGGHTTVDTYSPVTGQWYMMTCTPGVPTVCRGGKAAVVYIR